MYREPMGIRGVCSNPALRICQRLDCRVQWGIKWTIASKLGFLLNFSYDSHPIIGLD